MGWMYGTDGMGCPSLFPGLLVNGKVFTYLRFYSRTSFLLVVWAINHNRSVVDVSDSFA